METVIVFGGSGLLGQAIVPQLQRSFCVHAPSREIFDIEQKCNITDILKYMERYAPTYVINCSGILVAEAERRPEAARLVNTVFPQLLGDVCEQLGIKLLHFSTNCVFEGHERFYLSFDEPDTEEEYGKTKAGGESCNYITVRTSFIGYSKRRNDTGLFNWFFNTTIPGVKGYDVPWNGVTTLDIADHILFLLSLRNGIYHFSDTSPIRKSDLLETINYEFGLNKMIEGVHGGGEPKLLLSSWQLTLPPWPIRIKRIHGEMERSWVEGTI
jgi:dTDP-4-dehydrorhamnose reductase